MKIQKICLTCNQHFTRRLNPKALARGKGKYCSRQCADKGKSVTTSGKNSHLWLGGRNILCSCKNCAQEFYRYAHELKRGRSKFCSKSCQAIWESKNRLGKLAGGWINGNSSLYDQIRGSRKYRLWRKTIFERDHYMCQQCKQLGGELHADHIVPFALIIFRLGIKTLTDAIFCTILWDINNGRTLCIACHKKTPTYMVGTKNIIRKEMYA